MKNLKGWKSKTIINYAYYISDQYDVHGCSQIRDSDEFINYTKGLGNANSTPIWVWDYDIRPILAYLVSLGSTLTAQSDVLVNDIVGS
jgi:hypothetical protein